MKTKDMLSKIWNFFRRRSRETPGSRGTLIGIDLFMREPGAKKWTYMKRFRDMDEAEDASQIFAAERVFESGEVMFFESRFDPVYAEDEEPQAQPWVNMP